MGFGRGDSILLNVMHLLDAFIKHPVRTPDMYDVVILAVVIDTCAQSVHFHSDCLWSSFSSSLSTYPRCYCVRVKCLL